MLGSPMYDEYPDKTRLLGIRDRIFEIVHMENAACENDARHSISRIRLVKRYNYGSSC